ncbi:UDP-4-amino-4,6-dideoxy-N-acetyl-beta-L-altrosamine transaminase [Candidatus Woesearchaeota archaeon]|nr:UDP-4-amino-4,6-dideoxy-N-acetyl-beta-L-altrosamine transaminase [Candidatus Woesearchaeota archaeon]
MIPYGKQTINEDDVKEVVNALKSDFLTTGPRIKEFEDKFAGHIGVRYAVAVVNGTAALHLACLASGLKQGDELITSPMTFAASANCALYCGARPVFIDIDEQALINVEKIEEKITEKTKVIIPVHYTGLPCDMGKITEIADKHGLVVIEDACHALGAKYRDSKVGDCKYSDMTVFSFHPVKQITTGEGGIITTSSKELYEKLLLLRNHGITKDPEDYINENQGGWYNEMQTIGYNYRITDLQCALGISQLKKLSWFIEKRRKIAKRYISAFKDNKNIEFIKENEGQFNSYHLFVIKVKERLKLFNYLKERGVCCQVHYIPVYLHPYYQRLGYEKGLCKNAEEFYSGIMSLPMYPGLNEEEQEKVIKLINGFFENND